MVIYAFMHTEMHIIVSITLYFYLSYINVTVAVQVLDLPNRMDGKPNFAQKECMHKLSFYDKDTLTMWRSSSSLPNRTEGNPNPAQRKIACRDR